MLVLCIAACLLFSAGFLLRGNAELMEPLGIVAAKDPSSASQGASPEVSAVASRLDEVEKMLSSGSLDSYDADATTRAVLDSFLKNTDDAYARYFDDARYTSFVDVATDEYPGVGVFFSEQNGKAFALDVFENSSASDAGVRQGDVVVAIDGDRSQDWTVTETINAVQREAGSSVVITWLRPSTSDGSEGEEFTTTLICSDYQEPNVTTQLVDGVGYISLKQLTQNSTFPPAAPTPLCSIFVTIPAGISPRLSMWHRCSSEAALSWKSIRSKRRRPSRSRAILPRMLLWSFW